MVDLDAYFARIGYDGPRVPTLATLRAIHALHPAAIPFENLDPLLGNPVPLDLDSLQRKLVGRRRGGYCFEQNALFKAVLERLGFAVTGLAARVLWGVPPGAPPGPRSHMLLQVDLAEGAFCADVGFGGHIGAAPLALIPGVEQPQSGGSLRFITDGASLRLQTFLGEHWRDAYRFTREPCTAADYEVANWYTSTHPASHFRHNLVLYRATPQVRSGAFNRRVTRRFPDGRVEEATLRDADEFAALLEREFALEAPADAETIFARLPI